MADGRQTMAESQISDNTGRVKAPPSKYRVMVPPSFKKLAMVESQKPTCHRYPP